MSRICFMGGTPKAEYRFLYLESTLRNGGVGSEPRLQDVTERCRIGLRTPRFRKIREPFAELTRENVRGIVLSLNGGLPSMEQLHLAEHALSGRFQVWFHWPGESAIERIDRELLRNYRNHTLLSELWDAG